jgi:diguanylate cyclase (GGDEF)-like protein
VISNVANPTHIRPIRRPKNLTGTRSVTMTGTPSTGLAGDSIDILPVGVLVFVDGKLVRANDVWTRLTGLDQRDSVADQWLAAVHHEHRAEARAMTLSPPHAESAARDWRLSPSDGTGEVWVHARVRYLDLEHRHACVMTLTEIDVHKATEIRLLHLATHDALTGLPTRGTLVSRIELALGSVDGGLTAVLFIDLDHFKEINDRFGHGCGDRLLVAVAGRIQTTIRPTDAVARFGGDEIGVVLPHLQSRHEAMVMAERLVDRIREPFAIDGRRMNIGASIGIAFSDTCGTTADELIASADRAMYRAKAAGGGWWTVGASAGHDLGASLHRVEREVRRLDGDITTIHPSALDPALAARLAAVRDELRRIRLQLDDSCARRAR